MTFDDDIRNRIGSATPAIGDLSAGAEAVGSAAKRRSVTQQVAIAGAAAVVLIVGLLAVSSLRNETRTDNVRTADPINVPTSVPEPTTPVPEPTTPAPTDPVSTATGVITVDVNGIVRLNDEIIDPGPFQRPGVLAPDITITAVDGASGTLIYQTDNGVFKDGALWHKAGDAVIHDLIDKDLRTLIGWNIPEGNDPSGQVLGQWTDPQRDLPFLYRDAFAASYGPDGLILTSETEAGCTRFSVFDDQGTASTDHPVSALSRCIEGEIAEWSSAGHVVLVAPTQEDAWTITVLAADGRSAQTTMAGAFQPRQLDVHTDAAGRTEALILGTGEELVYVDVDLFLSESDPIDAVLGVSNVDNLVSARFVSGFTEHPYRLLLSQANGLPTEPDPPSTSESLVWDIVDVSEGDTLNARSGAGTGFNIVFEFASTATGVVSTGNIATAPDGGEWFEVFAPTSGFENDVGWVNSAFLEEAAVADGRPCLFNGPQDHYIGIDWTNPEGSPQSEASVISNIETYRFGGCIRTVIEFSTGWSFEDGSARASALPNDIVVTRNSPPTIDFGSSIRGAEVADARFDEPDLESTTFVSVGPGGGLDGVFYGLPTTMWVTFDNTNGTMIVDTADIRIPPDADPAIVDRIGAATSPLVDASGLVLETASISADKRTWTFIGLARPFEANLAVEVQTTNGTPLEVDWVNGVVEGQRSNNGVMTSTWTEAWGQFTFSITPSADVDAADLVVVFDPSGGAADDPETVEFRLADLPG